MATERQGAYELQLNDLLTGWCHFRKTYEYPLRAVIIVLGIVLRDRIQMNEPIYFLIKACHLHRQKWAVARSESSWCFEAVEVILLMTFDRSYY